MSNTPWIKWFPSDFLNGVSDLSPHEIAVFTVILCRIYDEDGPIPHNLKKIARRCNMRFPQCEKAVNSLAEEGKIIIQDGLIDNKRAQKERENRQKTSSKQTRNIEQRWQEGSEKPNKINKTSIPNGYQTDTKPIPTRSQKLEARKIKEKINKKEKPPIPSLDDFVLDGELEQYAIARGCDPPAVHDDLVGYCRASGKRYKDYRAAYMNFCRREEKERKNETGGRSYPTARKGEVSEEERRRRILGGMEAAAREHDAGPKECGSGGEKGAGKPQVRAGSGG
jgi:uncharacterized protein YdaU (DUF1376 family)|tara:strand:- start:64 stop:906 length:843 start_codon:yes stop_codon:yes gene_type:complete